MTKQDKNNPVSVDYDGKLAIVTIDNPPVNATSQAVRQGLVDAQIAVEKSNAKAVILCASGRTFVAGGDIKEFDGPPLEPHLPDLINKIEASSKPWVAALHGTTLGGGFEIAMGCHYRVALNGTRFGLPEVNIGLIPGATGTARLPRLIGIKAALDLITSGKLIATGDALKLGAIDKIVEDNLLTQAKFFAKDIIGKDISRTSLRPIKDDLEDAYFEKFEDNLRKKSRGQQSALHALQAVKNACTLSFEEAVKLEREKFFTLKASNESKALRYVFASERAVGKLGKIEGVAPQEINHVAIVGGGLMGAGIAASHLLSGLAVTIIERDEKACEGAIGRVQGIIDGAEKRGKLPTGGAEKTMKVFNASSNYSDAKSCDLAIEAVFEDLNVKQSVFHELAKHMNRDAILATNTSYLDPNEIFEGIKNQSRTIGLHFFSPAHIMKLLEIVDRKETSKETLATGFWLAKKLKKIGVRAGVCDGFIGNRMLATYRRQADYLIMDGASPYQVDEAICDFGLPMGPYMVQDMAGLQIGWANRQRQAPTRDPNERYVGLADQLCEMERFGQKSGKGWYIYNDEFPRGAPDPKILEMVEAESKKLGITRRDFTKEEIQNTIMAAMINEGARIIEEGVATRALDVDMVKLNGYGFPRWRGGPMFYANTIGIDRVVKTLDDMDAQSPNSWKRSKLLMRLADEKQKFV